jgi:site-specific DNA-adenine methylase
MTSGLVAPFPYAGGKRRAAELVWPALGPTVNSYIEPFAGSLAVLLARPGGAGKYETVNDIQGTICNFWRALRADPDEVLRYADTPIIEQDVHARHQWLVDQIPKLTEKLIADPHYFDAKIAGWWVWGQSCWIGDGWCRHPEWRARPDLTGRNGIHALKRQKPDISGRRGVHRKTPELHGKKGVFAGDSLHDTMWALADRLRHVRVCCGDFERVLSSAALGTNPSGRAQGIAPAGIFLDPPYEGFEETYGEAFKGVGKRVFDWAMEHGDHPDLRIVVAGYEGEHDFPESWTKLAWKAHGGYANQGDGSNQNAHLERLWLSPHCLRKTQHTLMEMFR